MAGKGNDSTCRPPPSPLCLGSQAASPRPRSSAATLQTNCWPSSLMHENVWNATNIVAFWGVCWPTLKAWGSGSFVCRAMYLALNQGRHCHRCRLRRCCLTARFCANMTRARCELRTAGGCFSGKRRPYTVGLANCHPMSTRSQTRFFIGEEEDVPPSCSSLPPGTPLWQVCREQRYR